jgi:ADP-ribose pyrophosphatase
MCTEPQQPPDTDPWVKILRETEDYQLGTLFRIVRAELTFRRFDGRMSDPVARINFERGDSVGVLLHDPQEDEVILIRQFRYPVYASLGPDDRQGDGARAAWLWEIVAGMQDEGRTATDVAHKELLEETGYKVRGGLDYITSIYPSPGGTSERIHLFLGEVDVGRRAGKGGGVVAEGEDIQIRSFPLQDAMDMITSGEIRDAKTIIALQHLALHRPGFEEDADARHSS